MGYERGQGLAPRRQRVAATIEEDFSLFPDQAIASTSSPLSPSAAPTSLGQLQDTMAEQNRILAALVKAQSSRSSF